MNKKFSTLVAVILAAGAWTTLNAKVVAVDAPKDAESYLIGASITGGGAGMTDVLIAAGTTSTDENVEEAEFNANKWTLEKGDGDYYALKNAEGKYLTLKNAEGGTAVCDLKSTEEIEAGSGESIVKAYFTIVEGKLVLDVTNLSENTTIAALSSKGLELAEGVQPTIVAGEGTAVVFASWEADAVDPGDADVVYPGFDGLTVDAEGKITILGLTDQVEIEAPMYIDFDGAYLTATADGKVTVLESAPTADQSLNASWRWEKGNLISVAAERAEKACYLQAVYTAPKGKAVADGVSYKLVAKTATPTTFTVAGSGLQFTPVGTGATQQTVDAFAAQVSAVTVSVDETLSLSVSGDILVDGSNLNVFTSMPSASEYVLVALTDGASTNYLYDNNAGSVSATSITLNNNYEQFLWKVERTSADGSYNYKFTNLKSKKTWNPSTNDATFNSETNQVNGFRLTYKGQIVLVDGSQAATGTQATVALYQSPIAAKTQTELDDLLDPGFDMTIKIAEKNNDAIKGIEVFGKTLYPIASTYGIKLADKVDASGAEIADETNYLVLDKAGWDGISASALNGEFIWVSAKDLKDSKKSENWLSEFQVRYRSGKTTADVMETLAVMDGATVFGNAFILSVDGINYLTTKTSITSKESWPYIKLASDNIVDVKTLLGKFWNIKFAETDVDGDEEYKLNSILAVSYDADQSKDVADYVKANSVLTSSPETQWAVVSVESNGTFTMQNRENASIKISGLTLRKTGDIYTIAAVANTNTALISGNSALKGDQVYMTSVASHTKFDGFRTATVNELRNQVFNIGQYHNETGNSTAFWTENHQGNGTHQLGVVADEEGAVQWRLRLDMKPKSVTTTTTDADYGKELAEVDTVLVITKMAVWEDNKFKNEEKADTLAILPYQIQNKGNLEYVIFNDNKNQNYYACDENDDVEPSALRFALKAKPNNTYNVVALDKRSDKDKPVTTIGTTKVYVANSTQWGSLKQIKTYSEDNNSLMQVIQIDKPEYRKIAAAWGDTVRIYREEYPTEELFEKADIKSVVDKDTLSFLNVDNSVTGANPALFVDTAYVNRVAADGTVNTCYQYLLAVNVDPENSYYCPYNPTHNTQEWRDEHNGGKPCADAMENRAVKGRFLINLVDTAFAYKQDHLHNNPYINMVEADENLAKLSFVEGIHANDTLYITRKGGEVVKLAMDTIAFNVAKFAFRYVDNAAGSFKIQTQYKNYDAKTLKAFEASANDEGYLRWVNGTIVVTDRYANGETFNMEENYAGNPTANENAPEVSAISVVATNGAVIVKGAEGKNVVITNVLGQQVANTVVSSSEATISAPAGVVVVAVEGEAAVKAIVK